MLTLKLALKNIINAGLRTWLNVFVLSFAFVLIIWLQGLYDGMMRQLMDAMVDYEIGGGQFWQRNYDPYDPFTIEDSHAPISEELNSAIAKGDATPILITSSAVFPQGRIQSALLKGIDPDQKVLDFPSSALGKIDGTDDIPALIGTRMAQATGLEIGDYVTIRWRDINGTFDAADIKIVEIMSTTVQSIDAGQIWLPLEELRDMMLAPNQATIITMRKDIKAFPAGNPDWVLKDHDFLLKDMRSFITQKKVGGAVMYSILLAMALLAIFDTQVLSIFRRRKEMGTMIALGMTRGQVIRLFTTEGTLHGFLAIIIGALYGIPILAYTAENGFAIPEMSRQVGLSLGATLYPAYGIQLFVSTSLLIFITVLVVSFLPTRKIANLKPTDALRGKTT